MGPPPYHIQSGYLLHSLWPWVTLHTEMVCASLSGEKAGGELRQGGQRQAFPHAVPARYLAVIAKWWPGKKKMVKEKLRKSNKKA